MTVVVELVTADREIREFGLRQAAAVRHFRRRPGVADVLGFAHEVVWSVVLATLLPERSASVEPESALAQNR